MKKVIKSIMGAPIAIILAELVYYGIYLILGNDELFLNELHLNFPNQAAVLKQIAVVGIAGIIGAYAVFSMGELSRADFETIGEGMKMFYGGFILKVVLPIIIVSAMLSLSIFTKTVQVALEATFIISLITMGILYVAYQSITVYYLNKKIKEKQQK